MESERKCISGHVSNTMEIASVSRAAVAVSRVYTVEFIPAQNYSRLESFLTYVSPSSGDHTPLPFAAHLKRIMGKTSGRCFANKVEIGHSTLSRLLRSERVPELATAAKIIENADLSDEYVYQIVADAATIEASDACRRVFSDEAPVLEGSIAEQFKGYRLARGLSQRILAERSNVSHSAVSRLESGERVFTFANLARLIFALGLNAEQVRGALHAAASRG